MALANARLCPGFELWQKCEGFEPSNCSMELSRLEAHSAHPVHSASTGGLDPQQQQQHHQQQQQQEQQQEQQQQQSLQSQGSGDLPHRNPGGRPPGWFRREHFLEPTTSEGRKNNRVQLTCKYCAAQIVSRSELLSEHCTSRCQQIPPDIRAQCVQQLVARQSAAKRPAPKPVVAKKPKQDRASGESSRGRLADPQQYELNAKLLRVFVSADVAFAHADSPVLQDLLFSLNPDFRPASAEALERSFLQQEFLTVKMEIKARLDKSQNVTVSLDAWPDTAGRFVFCCTVALPDRSLVQWSQAELAQDSCMPQQIADMVVRWIREEIGAQQVSTVVSDNAFGMDFARDLAVKEPRFSHMLPLRCMAQAFSLAVASMLGHPWACGIVKAAQQLACFFHMHGPALVQLMKAARSLDLVCNLNLADRSSLRQVGVLLDTLLILRPAIERTVAIHGAEAQVRGIAMSPAAWQGFGLLRSLLDPFQRAMEGVLARTATVADIACQWLRLAAALNDAAALDPDFRTHCTLVVNYRCQELNLPLCRLALFLDPRYKGHVDDGHGLDGLVTTAVEIMAARRYSEEECRSLVAQMQAYRMGHAPFNVPLGPAAAFRARRWWQCFDGRLTIANLAAYLCDIVPFAGTPHRQDTLLGWYLGKASPSGDSLGRLATIKTFLQHPPAMPDLGDDGRDLRGSPVTNAPGSAHEDPPSPEALGSALQAFYLRDVEMLQAAGMHQALSYQELYLGSQGGGFILDQRALDSGFVHQEQHAVPAGGLGGTTLEQGGPASFDPHALVLSALAH